MFVFYGITWLFRRSEQYNTGKIIVETLENKVIRGYIFFRSILRLSERICQKTTYAVRCLVCVWQPWTPDNIEHFRKNGNKSFSCAHQALFSTQENISQTKEKLDKYYGVSVPSIGIIPHWFIQFGFGRTSDAEHSGHTNEVTIPQMVYKGHGMILEIKHSCHTIKQRSL